MSVLKSVWQNWETGLDFRTRTDRAHCILGNIINKMHDAILHVGIKTKKENLKMALWFRFGQSVSPSPCPLCSLRVSMPLSVTLYLVSAAYIHCLPGRVTVDGLGCKTETGTTVKK